MYLISCTTILITFKIQKVLLAHVPQHSNSSNSIGTGEYSVVSYYSNDCNSYDWCPRNYYIERRKVTDVHLAQKICENKGMRLVSLEHDEKYLDVVKAIVRDTLPPVIFWTSGKRREPGSSVFDWGTKCEFEFTKWGRNQPDNYGGSEDCVEIGKDLTMNDFPCQDGWKWWEDYKRGFICESKTCK